MNLFSPYPLQVVANGQRQAAPLLERLDPVRRAWVLAALLGIILAGLALLILIVVAGRHVRRLARKSVGPSRLERDDWAKRPLVREPFDEHSENHE